MVSTDLLPDLPVRRSPYIAEEREHQMHKLQDAMGQVGAPKRGLRTLRKVVYLPVEVTVRRKGRIIQHIQKNVKTIITDEGRD